MKMPKRAFLAAYILRPMASTIKSTLLRDRKFCKRIGFKPSYSYPLTDSISVQSTSLIDALRAAVGGKKHFALKVNKNKSLKAKLRLQKNGSVTLTFNGRSFNIKDADLLAAPRAKRIRALARLFNLHPLIKSIESRWEEIAKKRSLTREQYLEVIASAGATPEAFRQEIARPQTLTIESLVPNEREYYQRLIAPWQKQENLDEFIATDLASIRRWILKKHRSSGLRRIAYSALSHSLMPLDLLTDITERELEELLNCNDPFSLLFGFEVARARATSQVNFVEIGIQFLRRLFGDKAKARCTIFSACSVAAITRLRMIFEEGSVPLFWFRVAALSHAGVLADALSEISKPEEFLQWVIQQVGPEYVWHTVVDRRDAPRWDPEWISPEQIHSELIGRCWNSIHLSPESERPKEWLEIVKRQVDEERVKSRAISTYFPGPVDDFAKIENRARNEVFLNIEEKLKAATTIADTQGLTGLVYLGQPAPEVATEVTRILESSRITLTEMTEEKTSFLHICAHLAALVRSLSLANVVIDECVRITRIGKAPFGPSADLFRAALIACAAARNHDEHRSLVGQTANKFSYVPSNDARSRTQLASILDILGRRDPKLIATLGRASAVSEAAALRS
jgi:hypothetical protein